VALEGEIKLNDYCTQYLLGDGLSFAA